MSDMIQSLVQELQSIGYQEVNFEMKDLNGWYFDAVDEDGESVEIQVETADFSVYARFVSCEDWHLQTILEDELNLDSGAVDEVIRVNPDNPNVPGTLKDIQIDWIHRANEYGDVGSCVLGAGFNFKYYGASYFMPPICKWQGSISWEHCKDDIKAMLEATGADDISYEYGFMD